MKHFFYICQSICLSLIDDNKLQLISWKKYKIYIKPPSLRRAIIMIAQTYKFYKSYCNVASLSLLFAPKSS